MFALRFDNINSVNCAACIVADLHAILFEPNGNISNKTDQRKRLISCYRSCIHVYSWRPVIIVVFDFRTKCAVTDRIETAYIVDDLQLLLFEPNYVHARVGNTCISVFKTREYGPGGGGSPVNWFCTTRELGPGDRIP